MNSGPLLFLGVFVAMASSFWGLVLSPQLQLGRLDVRAIPPFGQLYPSGRLGLAKEGAEIYRSLGCAECHTQQVRPEGYGGDIARGWGIRRTVAQDFLRDDPVQLGFLRLGPDLANVATRRPDAAWHYKHLYHPQSLVPNSTMPPYRFLFETRRLSGQPSPDALTLEGGLSVDPGFELVPREEARALVAYLMSLQADTALFEAPLPPPPPTNAPPTNAISGTQAAGVSSNAAAATHTP